jgi:hypothetical protein
VERLAMYPPFALPPVSKSLTRQQDDFTSEGAPPPDRAGRTAASRAEQAPAAARSTADRKPAKPGKWRELR